ncbi:Uncharacterized protein TCM_008492 [Theobroma cacao]|uniref:Uncharacterized protein n=1 Tax=Theobroma cacao TaxID=3641 RepID=A0A061E3Y5_THECC|nr:Uncharacterized protein TCM_008492 [Theobroma cacao]
MVGFQIYQMQTTGRYQTWGSLSCLSSELMLDISSTKRARRCIIYCFDLEVSPIIELGTVCAGDRYYGLIEPLSEKLLVHDSLNLWLPSSVHFPDSLSSSQFTSSLLGGG